MTTNEERHIDYIRDIGAIYNHIAPGSDAGNLMVEISRYIDDAQAGHPRTIVASMRFVIGRFLDGLTGDEVVAIWANLGWAADRYPGNLAIGDAEADTFTLAEFARHEILEWAEDLADHVGLNDAPDDAKIAALYDALTD